MLKVEHLYVSFTKEFFTLNDINIDLKSGQRLTIIGSKESGRTAMIRTLVGLEPMAKGSVSYKNISLEKIDFENDISLGYLPASFAFLENKSVKQNLEYVLKIRSKEDGFLEAKVNNALIEYGLDYIKNKKVKELNYLERLKLSIARLSLRVIDIFLIDDVFEKLVPRIEAHSLLISLPCTEQIAVYSNQLCKWLYIHTEALAIFSYQFPLSCI